MDNRSSREEVKAWSPEFVVSLAVHLFLIWLAVYIVIRVVSWLFGLCCSVIVWTLELINTPFAFVAEICGMHWAWITVGFVSLSMLLIVIDVEQPRRRQLGPGITLRIIGYSYVILLAFALQA